MAENEVEQAKQGFYQTAKAWGQSSVPPTLLATLIVPQHARPLQILPMLFPPALLFTTYLNLSGYKTDAAGTSAAWSVLYMLLASRRKHKIKEWASVRGGIRGATLALCAANAVGGGIAYATGRGGKEEE